MLHSFLPSSPTKKMASTCVNIPISPPHPDTSFLNIPWLSPPRLSLTNDNPTLPDSRSNYLLDSSSDFEFHLLNHPTSTVLPADQLFSNGKLLTTTTATTTTTTTVENTHRKITDDYIFSPKAPRCSSRWREILGLKNKKLPTTPDSKTTSLSKSVSFSTEEPPRKTASSSKLLKFSTEEITKTASFSSGKSIKRFLQKNTRTPTTNDTSITSPLLDSSSLDSLTESTLSISTSRLSLSSLSSSTSSSDDLHRFSLDETRPRVTLLRPKPNSNPNPVPTRPIRRTPKPIRQTGVSADSPRMNSAGKVVFQSLNRSSSSPGSFNGGPRYKHRGMERSYSANVRVTPVLNVPVCSSLRGSSKSVGFGFGQLFTSSTSVTQRKDKGSINGEKKRSSLAA